MREGKDAASSRERYGIPEPGGHQRDAGMTFGAGTIRPCDHEWMVLKRDGLWGSVASQGIRKRYEVDGAFLEHPGDAPGTVRCLGCGRRREEC